MKYYMQSSASEIKNLCTAVYSHKSMLNNSAHVGYVVDNMLIVFSVDLKVFFTVDNTDKQVINYMNGLFPDYFTTRSVLSMSCVCDF